MQPYATIPDSSSVALHDVSRLPPILLGTTTLPIKQLADLLLHVQSVEEIKRIVNEARSTPAGPAGWENDEYIDDAMDQEAYESSFDEWGMGQSM